MGSPKWEPQRWAYSTHATGNENNKTLFADLDCGVRVSTVWEKELIGWTLTVGPNNFPLVSYTLKIITHARPLLWSHEKQKRLVKPEQLLLQELKKKIREVKWSSVLVDNKVEFMIFSSQLWLKRVLIDHPSYSDKFTWVKKK